MITTTTSPEATGAPAVSPAGTTTPAKAAKAPKAKPAAKAPAKKAPAKTAAKSTKLRWSKVDDTDAAVGVAGDVTYKLFPDEHGWHATMRKGDTVTELVSGVGRTAAYKAAVRQFQTGEVEPTT